MEAKDLLIETVMRQPALAKNPLMLESIPSLAAMNECQHDNPFHHERTVLDHGIEVTEKVPATPILRVAALFHDCGKPGTKNFTGCFATYHKHDKVGAQIAEEELTRLEFGPKFVEAVKLLIRHHMYPLSYANQGPHSDKSVRRFVRRFEGNDLVNVFDLLTLNRADILSHKADVVERTLPRHEALLEHVRRVSDAGDSSP